MKYGIDSRELLHGAIVIGDDIAERGGAGYTEHVSATTGKTQAQVPLASFAQVDDAVAAARGALSVWSSWPPARRAGVLRDIGERVRDDAEAFAAINSLEVGNPYVSAHAKLTTAFPSWFEYYGGWADKITGHAARAAEGTSLNVVLKEPVGVVAKVLTWNAPMVGIQMSVAAALAAGCTVVIKPAELAPFACIRFARLCLEAGLPPGTVNVVPGDGAAGERLVAHPGVDKISFTGGLATAAKIQAAAARSVTPLVMELGGKSANIVFDDADIDRASAHASLFVGLAGQACTLPTRLLVQASIHDEMVERVARTVAEVRVGNPFDPSVKVGPVINEQSANRILSTIANAVDQGGAVVTGGTRLDGELRDGYFIAPTVVAGLAGSSDLAQNEVFGPVLTVIPFDDEDEAVAIANDSRYGLAAYVHTANGSRALRVASRLDVGGVGINGGTVPGGWDVPFGGVKESGYGREGGIAGIEEFLRTKTINIGTV